LSLADVKPASIRLNWAAQAPANADGCSAIGVATALLLGLVARERTGQGQAMLTSMLGTTLLAVSDDAIRHAGRAPRRMPDPELHGFSALYRLSETADGWLFLAAPKLREWAALAPLVGLADDARFASPAGRATHDRELAAALATTFAQRGAAEWERTLLA